MKWTARGYSKGGFGGVWAKGETREKAIDEIMKLNTELSGLELFKTPKETKVEANSKGDLRFKGAEEDEIKEIDVGDEELEEINERIKEVRK